MDENTNTVELTTTVTMKYLLRSILTHLIAKNNNFFDGFVNNKEISSLSDDDFSNRNQRFLLKSLRNQGFIAIFKNLLENSDITNDEVQLTVEVPYYDMPDADIKKETPESAKELNSKNAYDLFINWLHGTADSTKAFGFNLEVKISADAIDYNFEKCDSLLKFAIQDQKTSLVEMLRREFNNKNLVVNLNFKNKNKPADDDKLKAETPDYTSQPFSVDDFIKEYREKVVVDHLATFSINFTIDISEIINKAIQGYRNADKHKSFPLKGMVQVAHEVSGEILDYLKKSQTIKSKYPEFTKRIILVGEAYFKDQIRKTVQYTLAFYRTNNSYLTKVDEATAVSYIVNRIKTLDIFNL
jgi:hypothetical protein